MKKLLFTLLTFTLTINVWAQCTPNPIYPQTNTGNHPDALKTAWVDSSYSMTVTNVVPLDTTVVITFVPVSVTVDSVVILSIQGIPAGFASSCNPAKCVYLGGTTGCFQIYGSTSNSGLVGIHPLKVFTKTYAHLKTFGTALTPRLDTVKTYFLEIKAASTSGIFDVSSIGKNLAVYPNPTDGLFTAYASLKEATTANVRVYNAIGQIIINEKVVVTNNILNHPLDLSGSKAGIYFLEVQTENETFSRKISIK